MSPEQYMALSSLSYSDLSGLPSNTTISDIVANVEIKDYKDQNGNITPQFSHLVELNNYTLINFSSNPSTGFAGAAFQAPDGPNGEPGEIVFAFRGTEFTPVDYATDANIAYPKTIQYI